MSRTELDLRHAETEELKELLQRGWVHAGIGEDEQRFWLTEIAHELVDRLDAQAVTRLLTHERLPSNSLGAVIDASRPALGSEQARNIVASYLNHPNDYVVSAALRSLASTGRASKPIISKARQLSIHNSPLVRIAALTALAALRVPDLTNLLLVALLDPDRGVREAVLDIADDLAAEGALDSKSSSAILARAGHDRSLDIRRFAASRESLVEVAQAADQR